jgi:hypothetical protein
MKSSPLPTSRSDAPDSQESRTGRRHLVVGAGVAAGAALAAAAVLRRPAEVPAEIVKGEPETAKGQGYRLTEHVLRYYETTRS